MQRKMIKPFVGASNSGRHVLWALLIIVLALAAAPLHAAPKIRFETRTIVAERITPGATTVWFGLAHEPQPYQLRIREHARTIRDEDRDGIVRLELKTDVPPESVWVVADMTTGNFSVAEPEGGKIRIKPLPASALFRRGSHGKARVSQREGYVKFWVIRPGLGAWTQTIEDGGAGDDDRNANGDATAVLEAFVAVPDSPGPPDDFGRGDIVIALDPLTLRLFQMRVREEEPGR